ncbi:hypothetical protein [Pseudomonas sp. NPDC089569]|uniref:hypothetical protein n=1 Tax=Pseudomonas sp. NPDC089569 TaxID=3390722 RepID=UPI003CFC7115
MRKQHPGTCYRCNKRVEVGQGLVVKMGSIENTEAAVLPGVSQTEQYIRMRKGKKATPTK